MGQLYQVYFGIRYVYINDETVNKKKEKFAYTQDDHYR